MDKASNIIVWEKWKDPFGSDDIEEKLEAGDFFNEDNNAEEEQPPKIVLKNLKEQFMLTPLGLIPLTENTASGKIFNFWTGHTTFPISAKISEIIENIDGVETLDIFTKYRFRVSIGKAFQDSVILRNINETIYQYLNNE